MGIDEWMASEAALRPGVLLVRLYTWAPGGITIGFHQQPKRALNIAALGNTPLVRRITGGRGVYHDPSELTYAAAFSFPAQLSPAESSPIRLIFETCVQELLVKFLASLGKSSFVAKRSDPTDRAPLSGVKAPCFDSRTRFELTNAVGAKIVARAGRRASGLHFEHGSIKLDAIASHPALPLTNSAATLQPVKLDAFENASGHFKDAIWEVIASRSGPFPSKTNRNAIFPVVEDCLRLSTRFRVEVRDFPLAQRPFGNWPITAHVPESDATAAVREKSLDAHSLDSHFTLSPKELRGAILNSRETVNDEAPI